MSGRQMSGRVEAIREKLKTEGGDAFICYSHPNYRYLSGFTGSLGIVIVTLTEAVIISDFRYRTQIEEEVSGFEYAEISGPPEETVLAQLGKLNISKLAFESAHLTYKHYAQLRMLDAIELAPTENWVEDLRLVKDDLEVAALEKAVSIVDAAIEQLAIEMKPGMTEKQVANRINEIMRSLGAKKEAFDLIVAAGPRSAMPHAQPTDHPIEAGEPVVIDIGAQLDGYHSDLTRTVWMDRIGESQAAEFYEIVDRAQAAAIAAIKPGMEYSAIDAVARDIITDAGYGEYFGHSLGHGVGLEVHEAPTISRLGKGAVKPGMVFTVEPGIYVPDVGGVRIEDVVVVTDKGCRTLSASPHEPRINV
jgi:Xaa-Pro aminopeptidase